MPAASMALRYEGKGHKAEPEEGNLLLHNPEKNDNAIILSLCEWRTSWLKRDNTLKNEVLGG